jgi:hypothetical protein
MMISKAVGALSLLFALLFCAFVAQSALAAPAKNTTAFTCVEGSGDFSDAHCDNQVPKGTGKFKHSGLALKIITHVSLTNAKTANNTTEAAPTIIKGTIFGVKSEFTCKTITGEGELSNDESENGLHIPRFLIFKAELSSCVVNKPAGFGCKVKEPIQFELTGEGVEGLGPEKNTMGLEFKPTEGEIFSSVVIEGCFLKGTFNITGTAIGTGTGSPSAKFSGATNVFTNEMTKETLKLGGNPAEISSSTTLTMSGGGNPISFTTPT